MTPGLDSVTVVPGNTAPDSSVTVPPIAPTPCARADAEKPAQNTSAYPMIRHAIAFHMQTSMCEHTTHPRDERHIGADSLRLQGLRPRLSDSRKPPIQNDEDSLTRANCLKRLRESEESEGGQYVTGRQSGRESILTARSEPHADYFAGALTIFSSVAVIIGKPFN